jgi:hypothetical protein
MERDIADRCRDLKTYWTIRNNKFETWYNLLRLEDNLKEEGLESYISNEPRTYYNFAHYLLSGGKLIHSISTEGLSALQVDLASRYEKEMEKQWRRIDSKLRAGGKSKFQDSLVSYILAFGWYAVFALYTSDDGFIAEAYHPATVYPEFGDGELLRVAHIYTLSPAQANARVRNKDWRKPRNPFGSDVTLYDYWELDADGKVWNGIQISDQIVKDFKVTDLEKIPYFISPVGGLPDRGELRKGNTWQENCGESILGINERIYTQFNKYMSLTQEWLRNTAQPHWLEKTTGGEIITAKTMQDRGGIFRASPLDTIEPLLPPPIPADLKMQMFEIQNQIQRGALPYALYGNVSGEISGYLLSQIASGTKQNLGAYIEAMQDIYSNIDNYLVKELQKDGVLESQLPEDNVFETAIRVDIPSDMVQRATACRALSPTFRLSNQTITDTLFPEIKNPKEEMRIVKEEDAMNSAEMNILNLIVLLRNQIRYLETRGMIEQANLYRTLATAIESNLQQLQQPQPPKPGAVAPSGAPAPELPMMPPRRE